MVSQTCDQCGASVAADEQFCPECGAFLDPMSPRRRHTHPGSGNVISVSSNGTYEEFSLDEPPPAEPRPSPDPEEGPGDPDGPDSTVTCPSCGAINPAGNRHCQECGARLSQGPLPTAPRPAVQATAGVRAALGISGLLFLVIVVALLFNIFGGEETAADTTVQSTTTTEQVINDPTQIEILDVECLPQGLGAFTCGNLTSGNSNEYQVNWEELSEAEGNIKIKLIFDRPMIVTRIDWSNIEDPTRFRQNYRARGLTIDAQGSLTQRPHELQDTPGTQTIDYAALNANWIEITVQSAYFAERVADNIFRELAIDEIVVWGRPANPTSSDDTAAEG